MKKNAFLTIDDMPNKYSIIMADILYNYDIKADFFAVGRHVKKNCSIIKYILTKGHSVQNHSWSHTRLNQCSENQIEQEIVKAQNIINICSNQNPSFFRPPFGAIKGKKGIINNICKKYNLKLMLWDIATRDREFGIDLPAVFYHQKFEDDSIVFLMHSREKTTDSLSVFIEFLLKNNFQFKSLTEKYFSI